MRYLLALFATITSETSICNIALGLIGVGRIADINGSSAVERDCKAIFADARRDVLGSYHWRFARKQVKISQLQTAPLFGFSYSYQLPADCIDPISLADPTTEFRAMGDQLHCNLAEEVNLEYTADITDAAKFTSQFVTTLAHRLAAPLAMMVKKDQDLSLKMWDLCRLLQKEKEGSDSRSSNKPVATTSPYVEARSR
jgi:hypothetical protein